MKRFHIEWSNSWSVSAKTKEDAINEVIELMQECIFEPDQFKVEED